MAQPTAAPRPENEPRRLEALQRLRVLDTAPERSFDDLAFLAAQICGTPMALVSLIDADRQWFKARIDVAQTETPRDVAFCAHAILQNPMLEVCDARRDDRFADNPLVTGPPQIRFYAGVPIRTRDGHALGTVCVMDFVPRSLDEDQRWVLRVLAEQVAAQIELRRSAAEAADALRELDDEQALLRGLLRAATEYSVVVTTPSGTITDFSRGAEKMFGYRADEVMGRATPELFHDAAEVAKRAAALGISPGFEAFAAAARQGQVERREWTCIRKDGARFPAAVTLTAMRNESNEVTGFIGITRDLTEERRAERERQRLAVERTARAAADRSVDRLTRLHDVAVALAPAMTSREVFDILVQQASAAVGAQSAALMILKDDEATLELVAARGLTPEATRAFHTLPLTTALPISDALREGRLVFIENVLREARYREILGARLIEHEQAMIAAPLLAYGRQIGGLYLGFAESRAFGEEDRIFMLALGRLGAQAIDRARAYEAEAAAHRAAETANHAKDEFLAVLSHELRTPLTAVLGWAHMLRMPSTDLERAIDPAKVARGLAVIESNAAALLRFVEAILEVNRIVAGNLELLCGLVDLGEVVRETVEAMRPVAEAGGLTLTLTIEPGVSPINADPDRLRQIVANLLTNAIKFTPRGGRIDVRVDHLGDQVRLSVIDTGEGISPEFLPHVFERFIQADSTRTRTHGGLGIGLAIVKHLVALHGGTVTAKSAGRGQGAELTVLLPVATPPAGESPSAAAGVSAPSEAGPAMRSS
jgi:PAS domain S-box-containing protein